MTTKAVKKDAGGLSIRGRSRWSGERYSQLGSLGFRSERKGRVQKRSKTIPF